MSRPSMTVIGPGAIGAALAAVGRLHGIDVPLYQMVATLFRLGEPSGQG